MKPLADGRNDTTRVRRPLFEQLEQQRVELEQLNHELAEREARLRAIVDAEPECVKLVAADGSLLEMNPAGLRMIEADSFQQVAGLNLADLVAPEDRQPFRRLAQGVFRGESGTLVFQVTGLRGGRRWLETHATPLRDGDGAVAALLGITRDVTARVHAEEELRSREERYLRQRNALIALMGNTPRVPEGLSVIQRITECCAQTLRVARVSLWRYTEDRTAIQCVDLYDQDHAQHSAGMELFARDYPRYFAALGSVEVLAADDASVDSSTSEFTDSYLRPRGITSMMDVPVYLRGTVDGVLCHEHVGPARAWQDDEKVFGVAIANLVTLALEGSERDRAEADLRDARDRLKLAVRAGKVGLWDWDMGTGKASFSPEWKQQIGYADDEIADDFHEWQSRVHPDDLDRARSIQQACFDGMAPSFDVEFRLRHRNGSYRRILSRGSTLLAEDGTPLRLLGTHVDITESRELQAQLVQSQKMESVGQLAGGIAHDFNNLLTVINGTADLAIAHVREWDPLRDDLVQIREAGQRAASLVRQLLAFSRKQILTPDVIGLNGVVAGMEQMLRRLIGEHITLGVRTSDTLGAIKADAGQIEQVIMNLVVNARDAMPDGGEVTIETRDVDLDAAYAAEHESVQPGPHVMLAVSDTGIGMDDATRRRIFEPFFTTKGAGRGTGLGLSTVYGIVKQSGGSVWVYSEPGRGTTFKVYLPRLPEATPSRRAGHTLEVLRGSETILVVEDDPSVRLLAKKFLESAGYKVVTAGNGEDALMELGRHAGTVSLMMTDVVMPGMPGRVLGECVSQSHPAVKVLYSSGYTDDTVIRHGIIGHAAHFIAKPYTLADLSQKVRAVLGSGPADVLGANKD